MSRRASRALSRLAASAWARRTASRVDSEQVPGDHSRCGQSGRGGEDAAFPHGLQVRSPGQDRRGVRVSQIPHPDTPSDGRGLDCRVPDALAEIPRQRSMCRRPATVGSMVAGREHHPSDHRLTCRNGSCGGRFLHHLSGRDLSPRGVWRDRAVLGIGPVPLRTRPGSGATAPRKPLEASRMRWHGGRLCLQQMRPKIEILNHLKTTRHRYPVPASRPGSCSTPLHSGGS